MRGPWNTPPPAYTPLSFASAPPIYTPELCFSPSSITPASPSFNLPDARRYLQPRSFLPVTILALIWLLLGLCCLAVAVSLTHLHAGECVMLWQGIIGAVGGIGVVTGLVVLARVAWLLRGVRVEEDDEEGGDEEGFWGWIDGLLGGQEEMDDERGVAWGGEQERTGLLDGR